MKVEINGKRYVELGDCSEAAERLTVLRDERDEAIRILRDVCEEFGDNDWDNDLHLADIIEKHLHRNLRAWSVQQ